MNAGVRLASPYRLAAKRSWGGYARGWVRRRLATSALDVARNQSADANQASRKEALSRLLSSARSAPYWRERLADGLAGVEPLTKDEVRDRFAELENLAYRDELFENWSGGSTGSPSRVLQTWAYRDWAGALEATQYRWVNPARRRRKLFLWGALRDVNTSTRAAALRNLIEPTRMVNCFVVNDQVVEEAVRGINQFRPTHIIGYATALAAIAKRLDAERLTWRPPAIISSAATLYASDRAMIEQAFGAPVFNRYGGREIGGCAFETPGAPGLMVPPMTHLVEVIDEAGVIRTSGRGRLLVTPLQNLGFPMLRYVIGDIAVIGESPADAPEFRGWQFIKSVEGRETDHVQIGGKSIDSLFFVHVFGVVCRIPQLDLFQVAVCGPEALEVRLKFLPRTEPPADFDAWRVSVESLIQRELEQALRIHWRVVEEIPPAPSGKHRYLVQEDKL